jgi:hypothetical protein
MRRCSQSSRSLMLSEEQMRALDAWACNRRQSAERLRAQIVVACTRGLSSRYIAQLLRINIRTVIKWRTRFETGGVTALCDAPRCGAPRLISDAVVEAVLSKTLHDHAPTPAGWSSRALAQELGLSKSSILRIWHTFDVAPVCSRPASKNRGVRVVETYPLRRSRARSGGSSQ